MLEQENFKRLADRVGTPFWLYEAAELRRRIADVLALTRAEGLQARYSMKACSVRPVLAEMKKAGLWIDAVSANECLRARAAGFAGGIQPPVILYTADVLRDNWKDAVFEEKILPNLGSPGMLAQLLSEGYRGPLALRVNVGFGHGHVRACDTGGPSSKHGIWWKEIPDVCREAALHGCPVTMLHTHVGSGPQQQELRENLKKIVGVFLNWVGQLPDLTAVSLGGGLPWNYREEEPLEVDALKEILVDSQKRISDAAGRPIRLEIEPGRYLVASSGTLVTTVTDLKETQSNEKGPGQRFVMVDAGFVELARPAMYGSYHRMTIPGRETDAVDLCVAGPLCESGDVFTRGADEVLEPRSLPVPRIGDQLLIHDAGAYGSVMSSNYNSLGRAPQIWRDNGVFRLVSRRETLEDLLRIETDEMLF